LPLQRIDRDRLLPLSFAQQRLWFIEQMAPGNPAYHIPAALRLRGRLDVAALEDSFSELVRRHEALRTSFVSIDGEPQQSIHAPQPMPIPLLEADGDEALEQIIDEQVRLPFDLTEGPLLRLTLVRLANDDHVLVVVLHHIVADGWSMGVLGREIGALYAQRLRPEAEPALPELSLQYADFAVWQRAWLSGPVLERQLGYWKRQLADLPTLPLPTDRPRPALQSYRGGSVELHLDRELTERLVGLSRAEGCTLFMTLLAAYKALLARICSESDIVIGTPVANRNRTEIEGLIGFFVNMLVLRTDLAGDPSFRTLLHRVRDTALDAYAHQDLPFEMLVEALRPDRDPSRHPLFQVHFALHNASADSLLLDDIEIERALPQAAWVRFDLECHLWHEADRVHGFWVFNTDLFDRSTVERFSHHWQKLLAEAVRDADIVVCATTSRSPVLDGAALRPGTFVAAVGANQSTEREVDDETIRRATRRFIDSRADSLANAGDLLGPLGAGVIVESDIGDIADLVSGRRAGRQGADEITYYKSIGVPIQDLVTAQHIARRAAERGIGTVIDIGGDHD